MEYTKTERKAMFNRMVKGKNFMTPNQIEFFEETIESKDYIAELSQGENFTGGLMFGVTYLNIDTGKINTDFSRNFKTEKEARDYIRE